jgi:hypothetical protein
VEETSGEDGAEERAGACIAVCALDDARTLGSTEHPWPGRMREE